MLYEHSKELLSNHNRLNSYSDYLNCFIVSTYTKLNIYITSCAKMDNKTQAFCLFVTLFPILSCSYRFPDKRRLHQLRLTPTCMKKFAVDGD